VAGALLAAGRMDAKRGSITIPPHCGVELFDVVSVWDGAANQAAVSFRVSGYSFVFDTKQGIFQHQLTLSAP
jgi:hypothetical protein